MDNPHAISFWHWKQCQRTLKPCVSWNGCVTKKWSISPGRRHFCRTILGTISGAIQPQSMRHGHWIAYHSLPCFPCQSARMSCVACRRLAWISALGKCAMICNEIKIYLVLVMEAHVYIYRVSKVYYRKSYDQASLIKILLISFISHIGHSMILRPILTLELRGYSP